MINQIDFHDLPQEEVKFIQKVVEPVRERINKKQTKVEEKRRSSL